MIIKRVEIKNIKSHEDSSFDFDMGVTAICGPNGAGKTSIIESIAWVLFDYLNYKKEDFVRKGARKGSCTVTLVSSLDGKEYSVHRDSLGNYYVYDVVTQTRIAQQKNEVLKWLCQQHGVEPGTDLATLFRITIGVPQGTFTYDFADTPSNRKVTFDKILKVDEYTKAAEKLKDLVRYIQQKIDELEKSIARDEGELVRYKSVVEEHKELLSKCSLLEQKLTEYKNCYTNLRDKLSHYEAIYEKLNLLSRELEGLEGKRSQQLEQRASLQKQLDTAKAAAQAVEQSRPGYELYLSTHKKIEQLEKKRREQQALLAKKTQMEQLRAKLEAKFDHHEKLLAQIAADRNELEALTAKLEPLDRLEKQKTSLQQKLFEREMCKKTLSNLGKELDRLQGEHTSISKRIEELERFKNSDQKVAALESELSHQESSLTDIRLRLEKLTHLSKRATELDSQIDKLENDLARQKAKLQSLFERRWQGDSLDKLELNYNLLTKELAEVKAKIDHNAQILRQIHGGLCPLLQQKCLNMKEGQTLEQYFQIQLDERHSLLKEKESQLSNLYKQIQQARADIDNQAEIKSISATCEQMLTELQEAVQKRQEVSSEIAQLGEEATLQARLEIHVNNLQQLRAELTIAQQEKASYSKIDYLRESLNKLNDEIAKTLSAYQTEEIKLKQFLNLDLDVELRKAEEQLSQLARVRATAESLKRQISREPQLISEKSSIEKELRQNGDELAKLEAALRETPSIEADLQQSSSRLETLRKDYEQYMQNLLSAKKLPVAEANFDRLLKQIEECNAIVSKKRASYDNLASEYDKASHLAIREQVTQLATQIARAESDLGHARERLLASETELSRLEAVSNRHQKAIVERDKLKRLVEFVEFIRECLKKAGPYIIQTYLHHISLQANKLYCEITGNSAATLRWKNDYEVVLEESGLERSFYNLSGGEQMIAAIALRLALLQELSELRLAFFDEPTTNVDEERRYNLAQQIGRIKDFQQLFVVSHDDSFHNYTDKCIKLEKVLQSKT
ncbi:MAG: SMC family ATPase [Acidobacteriota bacterium]|nr:SMC family ATPase [Blastocatellia bacterium]MDW8413395.1 SMC family ATPase [Acidobacteriota bacterium]